jgi:hypothetical protein
MSSKKSLLVGLRFGMPVLATLFLSASLYAGPPPCTNHGLPLPLDNNQALQLKATAPLGKTLRAHVSGRVTRVFADQTNGKGTVHDHFEIQIGDDPKAVLEVVYSEDFGVLPGPNVNAQVEACGDFINSYARNGGSDPSPSGAIIHWVHQTDTPSHDAGFVLLDNVLYGYGTDLHPHH